MNNRIYNPSGYDIKLLRQLSNTARKTILETWDRVTNQVNSGNIIYTTLFEDDNLYLINMIGGTPFQTSRDYYRILMANNLPSNNSRK